MNKTLSQNKAASQTEMLLRIKETLREEVIEGVRNQGLQQRLFSEYYDLAGCTSSLLGLLQNARFVESLSDADRQQYDSLMTKLSCCGLRAQILLEQSTQQEYETVLQTTEPPSGMAN